MTQHCTIDLNPPPISLLMNAFQVKEAKNGRVEHRILARIPSVADLVLTACGDGVLDVNALPWPSGMVPRGKTKRTGNCMEKYFDNLAAGKWVLSVTTAKADTQFTLKPVLQ